MSRIMGAGAPLGAREVSHGKFGWAIGSLLALAIIATTMPSEANVYAVTRYVAIDHETHTAYTYNENFQKLADNPRIPGASIEYFPDKARWLLAFATDVVRRHDNGQIEVVSHQPAYHEMVHHFVFAYSSPNRETVDSCGNTPIAAGSELTDVWLPAGYAYKMHGGALMGAVWHWENPAHVHHPQVYLRFILVFDDADAVYRDTHVNLIGTLDDCDEEFAIPPGRSEKKGAPETAPKDMRVVAVFPHTHDHVEYIELRRSGTKLRRFYPEYAPIPVGHDDVGEGETPWHVHKDHLPAQGLNFWLPGKNGPFVRRGEPLSTYAKFNNPHGRSIDNMVIFVTFWEEVHRGPH